MEYAVVNEEVYNIMGDKVGYYVDEGYVYQSTSHVGTVHGDGRIYDYEFLRLVKVAGDHIESGGAALLLLVR